MWWSPDSLKLAFIKFNDSLVEFYSFPIYDGSQYGSFSQIRYPKTDTKNPTASVFVHNTVIGDTIKLQLHSFLRLFRFYMSSLHCLLFVYFYPTHFLEDHYYHIRAYHHLVLKLFKNFIKKIDKKIYRTAIIVLVR